MAAAPRPFVSVDKDPVVALTDRSRKRWVIAARVFLPIVTVAGALGAAFGWKNDIAEQWKERSGPVGAPRAVAEQVVESVDAMDPSTRVAAGFLLAAGAAGGAARTRSRADQQLERRREAKRAIDALEVRSRFEAGSNSSVNLDGLAGPGHSSPAKDGGFVLQARNTSDQTMVDVTAVMRVPGNNNQTVHLEFNFGDLAPGELSPDTGPSGQVGQPVITVGNTTGYGHQPPAHLDWSQAAIVKHSFTDGRGNRFETDLAASGRPRTVVNRGGTGSERFRGLT